MSRFIQNYNQHLLEAERSGDTLVLRQRGGRPAWVLETEDRANAAATATGYLAAALYTLVSDPELTRRFANEFVAALPWIRFLPTDDRLTFVTETIQTLRACAALGNFTAFDTLVADWRNTAEIWSDPHLAAALTGPIAEPIDTPVV